MTTEVSPDERALRMERRERALAQMRAHDLDILVLGRQANIRYVVGAPQQVATAPLQVTDRTAAAE